MSFRVEGCRLVGPRSNAPSSREAKSFAKRFLERHRIPTARMYAICESAGDAYRALESVDRPVVMKADGLCGGKGVLVTASRDEARAFVESVMEKRALGDGGKNMLARRGTAGAGALRIVLADGKHFVPLVPARDHKRALDHDQGPNTGGMGAYSTDSIIPAELERQILETVVKPTFDGLAADGLTYQGFLYFGLMLTPEGPKVLEFNCRLGDPETQAIVARMDFDLAEALAATTEGTLDRVRFAWRPGASLCVVMASGGYPGRYEVGKKIEGLAEAAKVPDAVVFHAATESRGGEYYTCSGRVLGVTATGPTLEAARRAAYQAVCKIQFDGKHYRARHWPCVFQGERRNWRLERGRSCSTVRGPCSATSDAGAGRGAGNCESRFRGLRSREARKPPAGFADGGRDAARIGFGPGHGAGEHHDGGDSARTKLRVWDAVCASAVPCSK